MICLVGSPFSDPPFGDGEQQSDSLRSGRLSEGGDGDISGRNRFDSFRFRTFRKLIGSVRFGSEISISGFDAVRPVFFGRFVARSGSVRFVSASGSDRFQNSTVRFGSVRPVRFGF